MQVEHHLDPVDRASAETDAATEDALARQAGTHQQYMGKWRPVLDPDTGEPTGECACGCGRDVDPRRVALGYGLAIECAERIRRR